MNNKKSKTNEKNCPELSHSTTPSKEKIQSIKDEVSSWPEWKIKIYDANERRSVKIG